MNKILILLSLVLLTACGPSQEDKETIAAVTCSIIGETRGMDAAIRVREMNEARVKIGGEPFLGGDDAIKESLEWGLCQKLVLNESYDETLQPLKDAKQERERVAAEKRAEENRIAAEKRAEEERIASEKRAEEERIAAEKQRIADSKPTVEERFHSNGKLKSRINYQPKSNGGLKHGLYETFHPNGKLETRSNYKNGKIDGTYVSYASNGKISHREFHDIEEQLKIIEYYSHPNDTFSQKVSYKNDKPHGIWELYHRNGKIKYRYNYSEGKKDGLQEDFNKSGKLIKKEIYKDGVLINSE
jgi:antitoxin component YwqK of YwqJK toxin-antitoxin module